MELIDVIMKRRSVRKFENKEVSNQIISEIIKIAGNAPSAGGLKSYEVIVTTLKVTHQTDAPVFLVICANQEKSAKRYGIRGRDLYAIQDATIFGAYIQLIAEDRGLNSCWIGAFNENRVKKQLQISKRPIAIIALGYGSKTS